MALRVRFCQWSTNGICWIGSPLYLFIYADIYGSLFAHVGPNVNLDIQLLRCPLQVLHITRYIVRGNQKGKIYRLPHSYAGSHPLVTIHVLRVIDIRGILLVGGLGLYISWTLQYLFCYFWSFSAGKCYSKYSHQTLEKGY